MSRDMQASRRVRAIVIIRRASDDGYNSYYDYIGYYSDDESVSGDVVANLVEEVTEGGGIAGLDDGGELGEFGAYGA